MQEDQIDHLLLKVLEKRANENELRYFRGWMDQNQQNRQTFESLKKIWEQKKTTQDQKAQKVRDMIWQRSKSRKRQFPFSNTWKVAASLFLIIAALLGYEMIVQPRDPLEVVENPANLWIEKEAVAGVKLETVLPDGSIVKLNSNSRMRYQKDFNDTLRVIRLWGEAYFDVVKDTLRPFTVITDRLETRVLGTEFNISAYQDEEIMVSLVEGKVKVTHPQMDSAVYLAVGKSLRFNQQETFSIHQFDRNTIIGWKNGNLVFNNVSFDDFIKKLERWYGVKVKVTGNRIDNWNLNGTFSNEPLENVLEYISYGRSFSYSIDKENVLLEF